MSKMILCKLPPGIMMAFEISGHNRDKRVLTEGGSEVIFMMISSPFMLWLGRVLTGRSQLVIFLRGVALLGVSDRAKQLNLSRFVLRGS